MIFTAALFIALAFASPRRSHELRDYFMKKEESSPFSCRDELQIQSVHIIAETHNSDSAASHDTPDACFKFANGETPCFEMPDLAGSDFTKGKSSWWEMDDWNGRKLCDIKNFIFKAGGSDGWGFTHLVVTVMGSDGKAYLATLYEGALIWIDSNDADSMKQHVFGLLEDFGKNKGDAADAKVQAVWFIAEGKGSDGENGDVFPWFHIRSNKVEYKTRLYDHGGNSVDDMSPDRTDIWKFTSKFNYMKVDDVGAIWLTPESSDGWRFDRAMVIIKTNMGYYTPTLEHVTREVDSNDTAEKKHVELNMIDDWFVQAYDPKDLKRGGYWKFVHELDPFGKITLSQTASFFSEKGTITEKSRMEGYEETWSKGGKFEMCGGAGKKPDREGKKVEVSAEACLEFNWNHDETSSWQNTVTHSVENRISAGIELTCEQEFACPTATIINPNDVNDITETSEACFVYQWVTFIHNDVSGHMETLETCEFDLIIHYPHKPQCVPGQLVAETDSQTCYDPQSPNPPPEENEEMAMADKLLDHFANNFTIYFILCLILAAGGFYKYRIAKDTNYQYVEMEPTYTA